MKIAHIDIDPTSGKHFALISGAGAPELQAGGVLRCGAYRFEVIERVRDYPEAPEPMLAVLLDCGQHPGQEGMVVHRHAEALTDEEFSAAVQHLLMLPRMLLGIDVDGVLARINRADGPATKEVAGACNTVEMLARAAQAALLRIPRSEAATEAQRYAGELTRVTAC